MASIDGTSRVNLTAGRSLNLMPTWGPDNRIYFVSNRGGLDNIWSIGTEKALAATGAKQNHEIVNAPEQQKPEH
jgi:Tol biopolymer transport system component